MICLRPPAVYWLPPVKFHSMCKLDVSYFPFDDQICYLHFGSWVYDSTQVDVVNYTGDVTIDAGSLRFYLTISICLSIYLSY